MKSHRRTIIVVLCKWLSTPVAKQLIQQQVKSFNITFSRMSRLHDDPLRSGWCCCRCVCGCRQSSEASRHLLLTSQLYWGCKWQSLIRNTGISLVTLCVESTQYLCVVWYEHEIPTLMELQQRHHLWRKSRDWNTSSTTELRFNSWRADSELTWDGASSATALSHYVNRWNNKYYQQQDGDCWNHSCIEREFLIICKNKTNSHNTNSQTNWNIASKMLDSLKVHKNIWVQLNAIILIWYEDKCT